jgi:glycosyltransferase involved in cell wall biosynthesis
MGDFPLGKNEFSIIIPIVSNPVNSRRLGFTGAVESIIRQSYPNWELIIVDDGCTDEIPQIADEYAKKDSRIKVIHHKENTQRAKARNDGMKVATKDWICWLDSDDEYFKTYLEVLNSYMTEDYPGYKCYNYGATIVRMGFQSVRETREYKENPEGSDEAMERFPSGGIGSGSFCFHKSCLNDVGYLPEGINPYQFADMAKEERPEIVEWYGPIPTNKISGSKSLGNPWGDDWYMFYKITRKFKSKALPIAPYVQYVRRQGFSFQPLKDY